MSAIQCWPQLFGQPVTCSFKCCSKPGSRSSSSSTSQREKLFVSVMASLQYSDPLQATAPRQNEDTRTGNPISSSDWESASTFAHGTLTISRFCILVVRNLPSADRK